jgi:hypothetical protein
MMLRSRHPVSGRPTRPRHAALLILLGALIAAAGCARTVSLADVGSSGPPIWVRLTTTDAETVTGQLVSLDAGGIVVSERHRLVGDVRVRELGGEQALYSGVDRLPGELAAVETDADGRFAVVHRAFRAVDVSSASFHEGGGERSLATILSLLLGPVVGGALGFVL